MSGVNNRLLFCQCTAYVLAFVLALFAAVPLGQEQHELRGHCLLYAAGRWQRGNASRGSGCAQAQCVRLLRWGPASACRFSLFVSVFSCACAALQAFRSACVLYGGVEESHFSEFIGMLLSCTIAVMTLIAGATVSEGLKAWCSSITDKGNTSISCRDIQEESLNQNVVSTLFYDHFGTAQFALWCAWVVWIILAVLHLKKVSQNRGKDNCTPQKKEALLNPQTQGYLHGQVTNVFI
ncbi:transmembrane protein 179-like isoform X1 [Mobula birostris]|uniref:transmembrane protein 179-like isoform X1 n=1 Tax=Mobula birostris TaxID=1983395 RepID=UPI003B284DE7